MKPTKRLAKDFKAFETPQGFNTFGKNGIWNGNTEALQNEPGFAVSPANLPYTHIGTIETDGNPILFSTDDVNSAYGFYDEVTDLYVPIEDDIAKSYKLGFKRSNYIIGEARRNSRNNIEIAWLDKLNPIRFADTTNLPTNLANYLLFPEYKAPTVDAVIVNGGALPLGAFYVGARYLNDDGTETRYSTLSNPVFSVAQNFSAIPGSSTGRALRITLTDLDTNFKRVQLVIVRKIDGITTAVELAPVTITNTVSVLYTGSEGEDITLEEALIPAAFYDNAGSITQLNDILYLADMTEADTINLQRYANMIQLRYKSEYHRNIEADDDIKTGKKRTFKHGEAYCFYAVFKYANGRVTNGFHIPGIKPLSSQLLADAAATAEGFSAKIFQTNTVGVTFNTADNTGKTGVWVNDTEVYPNTADFDSSAIGGEDLRGQKVRHHKMPTLNQTLNNFYSSPVQYPEFGATGMDILGIIADNVQVPPNLAGQIVGYELYYAKRDYSNATILSQGMIIHSAKSGYTGADEYFTGGNFNSRMLRSDFSSLDGGRELFIAPKGFKINHPDLMVNRPAIVPSFVALNYKIRTAVGAPNTLRDSVDELNFTIDYEKGTINNKAYLFKGITDTGYVLVNGNKGVIKNLKAEDGFTARFKNSEFFLNIPFSVHGGRDTEGDSFAPAFEEAPNVDIISVRGDLYNSFMVQDLVRTGVVNPIDITLPRNFAFGGDCFLVAHSYFSYGLTDSVDRFFSNPGRVDGIDAQEEDTYTDEFFFGTSGNKVARRYITESSINMWQRYIDPAIPQSKFWPAVNPDLVNGMNRLIDNNTIAVPKESTAIGDLLNGIKTYDFNQVNIKFSPYKIVRSLKQQREGISNSWKNYNALDYYETEKNMGRIMNLQGYDGRLIIHHRNALFITEDKTTLQGDILSVTLGTGDIFRFDPKKGKESKTGYGGTQHQLACKLTDFGYIFPDAETGNWFVLNHEGLNEMNNHMYNFFLEYLNIPEINPYVGNGICVGFDREYGRLLVTIKNQKLGNIVDYVPNYKETPEFFAGLTPGVSIVFREGRYQKFLGVNTSEYSCEVFPAPTIGDYNFNIDELSPVGTLVGTVAGTGDGPLSYTIISGNTSGAFAIDSSGNITVLNPAAVNESINPLFELVVQVTDIHGATDTGNVDIVVNEVAQPPVTQDYVLSLEEHTVNGTLLQIIAGTDPKGLPLTFSILSQSVGGAVTINAGTGALTILDSTKFDFITNSVMNVVVRVSNGTLFADSTTIINLTESPTFEFEWVVDIEYSDCEEEAGENTGYLINYKLKKQSVPDGFPLDEYNKRTTGAHGSGRPQALMDTPIDDERRRVLNTEACPVTPPEPVPAAIYLRLTRDINPYVEGNGGLQRKIGGGAFGTSELFTYEGTFTSTLGFNVGDTARLNTFHYHLAVRWPALAGLGYTIRTGSFAGPVVHTFPPGGSVGAADIDSYDWLVTETAYYIDILTDSTSTDYKSPVMGYDFINNTIVGDGLILVSAVDEATGIIWLGETPSEIAVQATGGSRSGAYNLPIAGATQGIPVKNNSGQVVNITVTTVPNGGAYTHTESIEPGGSYTFPAVDKVGFVLTVNN